MLGGAIVKALQKEFPGAQLYSLARGRPLPLGVESLTESDLRGESFDLVVHAASPASPSTHVDPVSVFDANVRLSTCALRTVRPGGVFVFVSTGEVYGPSASTGVSEAQVPQPQLTGPRSFYPIAKLAGESISNSRQDVRSLIFRTFHTFGPGVRREDGRSFADFLWGAATKKQVTLTSDGSAVRSFLHIDDFSSGVICGIMEPKANGLYNIGEPKEMSVFEFASRVSEISGAPLVLQHEVPKTELTPSPISRISPNVSKLEAIGWTRAHSTEDAIRDTLHWIELQSGARG